MKEIWKDVVGYEGLYKISSFGRVSSMPRCFVDSIGRKQYVTEKILRLCTDRYGYQYVTLVDLSHRKKHYKIHRLVALAFIENPQHKPEVNHINGDKTNNHVDNLEWATSKENINHAFNIGIRTGEKQAINGLIGSRSVSKSVKCVETGDVFDSYKHAACYYGVSAQSISECVRKYWKVKRKFHLVPTPRLGDTL